MKEKLINVSKEEDEESWIAVTVEVFTIREAGFVWGVVLNHGIATRLRSLAGALKLQVEFERMLNRTSPIGEAVG